MKTKLIKILLQIVLRKQKEIPWIVGLQDDKATRAGGKSEWKKILTFFLCNIN